MGEPALDSLSNLKGKTVLLTSLDDQLRMETDDGWMLSIYNRTVLSDIAVEEIDAHRMFRIELIDYVLDKERLMLLFAGGATIVVDMSETGYEGPEAMQLSGPDGNLVIWN